METSKAPRKMKRTAAKAKAKQTNLLVIPREPFIGHLYLNGFNIDITENHAIVSRVAGINVFPAGTYNYLLLRQTYELSLINEEIMTKEEKELYYSNQVIIGSFLITDFAGLEKQHAAEMTLYHFRYLEKSAQERLEETSETILNDIEDFRGIMALKDQSNIDTLFLKDDSLDATK